MIGSSPCIICHEPRTHKKDKLRRIEELCRGFSDDTHGMSLNVEWGLYSHCRYGLSCHKLNSYDRECRDIASRIERTLIDAILSNDRLYHDIYELCRGDFPSVCSAIEHIHYKFKSKA